MNLILKATRFNRALCISGALFFSYSCASRSVQPWNLRDIHSLDAHVLNTKQWLKKYQGENKDLQKLLIKEMNRYKDEDFRIYERLEYLSVRMEAALEMIKKKTTAQAKLTTRIKRSPKLAVFEVTQAADPDTAKQDKNGKKRGFFKRREKKDKQDKDEKKKGFFKPRKQRNKQNPEPAGSGSDKAASIRSDLEANSINIIETQAVYLESRDLMIELFDQEDMRLVFIRDQVEKWKHQLNELRYKRAQLQPRITTFHGRLNEALFQSAESAYTQKIINASKIIEEYEKEMNDFEKYVQGMERTAKKEVKRRVYIIPAGESKKYEKKYRKRLMEYKNILYDLRKVLESV